MSVRTFVLTFSLVLAAAFSGSAMAQIRVLSTESAFGSAVTNPKVASFDALPTGYLSSLVTQLNGVSLTLNLLYAAPIYAAGSFGIALTTNYLSAAVQDGINTVFLEFPANTRAAGMRVVTVRPVAFIATSQSGEIKTILLSTGATISTVGFVGFSDPSGLKSIRVSFPATSPGTPIVNIGNIFFATELVAAAPAGVPLFSPLTLLMLAGSLVLVVWANQRREARA